MSEKIQIPEDENISPEDGYIDVEGIENGYDNVEENQPMNSNEKLEEKFEENEAESVERMSIISESSLLKDLEERWDNIEKRKMRRKKQNKTKRRSNNTKEDRDRANINFNFNCKRKFNQYNLRTIINKPDHEFDDFVKRKSLELNKFKRGNNNKNEKKIIIDFEDRSDDNPKHKSIVYESNAVFLNSRTMRNLNSAKPSFLKSYAEMTYNHECRDNIIGNGPKMIVQPVYENECDNNQSKPSKNLLENIKNTFWAITCSKDLVSDIDTESINANPNAQSNYRSLTLDHLQKNFNQIFQTVNPNVRNSKAMLNLQFPVKYECRLSKDNKYSTMKDFKFYKKMEENTLLMNTLFADKDKSNPIKRSNSFAPERGNQYRHNIMCPKNRFDDMIILTSSLSSFKVAKFMDLN